MRSFKKAELFLHIPKTIISASNVAFGALKVRLRIFCTAETTLDGLYPIPGK